MGQEIGNPTSKALMLGEHQAVGIVNLEALIEPSRDHRLAHRPASEDGGFDRQQSAVAGDPETIAANEAGTIEENCLLWQPECQGIRVDIEAGFDRRDGFSNGSIDLLCCLAAHRSGRVRLPSDPPLEPIAAGEATCEVDEHRFGMVGIGRSRQPNLATARLMHVGDHRCCCATLEGEPHSADASLHSFDVADRR